ncbi:MAG: glycosyltransferase [Microcoleaceae cyanobacterium]
MRPRVSILIPCYNAERWIAQAIESALNQTYENKEVIVIDVGSTDNSLEIIKRYSDQIQWETQLNQGGNIARNRLLELSTGEWLQYLDSDDYLLSDKIERQVQFLEQVSDIDIVYSPSILEYHQGEKIWQEVLDIPEPHDPWILLARWYLPQTGSPLWRKQAILDVGGWKVDQPCCQEHELYLRLLIGGKKFEYCPYSGSIYRQWSESTLCKKDVSRTQKERLAIKDRLEQYLSQQGKLTPERQHAINQARFECARMIWLSDQKWAKAIISYIKNTDSNFLPTGSSAPKNYQWAYQLLGFGLAERIAQFKRKLVC